MNQMLAKKVYVDRMYIPCQGSGRSLRNLEKEYTATMIGLKVYMTNKDDVQYKLSSDTRTPRVFTLYPRKLRNTFMRLEQQKT